MSQEFREYFEKGLNYFILEIWSNLLIYVIEKKNLSST